MRGINLSFLLNRNNCYLVFILREHISILPHRKAPYHIEHQQHNHF